MADGDPLHEQSILVAGFLGGIALTSLVIVLQYAPEIQNGISRSIWGEAYYVILITIFAGSSVAFIFSCIASLPIAGGDAKRESKTGEFAGNTFALGLFGLFVSVPMLLFALTKASGIAIAIFIFVLVIYFARASIADDPAEQTVSTKP